MVIFLRLLYIITIVKKPCNIEPIALVNPLESHLGYQLRRASVLLMTDLSARLAPTGLRPSEVTTLLVIHANEGCQQGAVGDLLGIKPANMVPLIARLVKQGLVQRAKADGRAHSLSLSPIGRANAAAIKRLLKRHDSVFQSKLGRPACNALLASLALLRSQQEV
jgi:DNA-binding MarR family transcriptional regulator